MARSPKMRRRVCPVCRQLVAVYPRGSLYRHGDPPRLLCPGSGFTPETLVAAMIVPSATERGSALPDEQSETTVETTTTEQQTTEQTTVEQPDEPKPDEPKPDDEPTE